MHQGSITPHPNEQWMTQVARNVTMADVGFLSSSRYLIHDRDSKFCESFHRTIEAIGVTPVKLPARSPDLNSFAERWVKSVKEECLSKLILFGALVHNSRSRFTIVLYSLIRGSRRVRKCERSRKLESWRRSRDSRRPANAALALR